MFRNLLAEPSPPPNPRKNLQGYKSEVIRRFLAANQQIAPQTLIDLGTGHGAYAIMARDMGYDVTGIDARMERIPTENADGIEWLQMDVCNRPHPKADVMLALGLFYHLPLECQRSLVAQWTKKTPVLIDTHVVGSHHPLMEIVDGFCGVRFKEGDGLKDGTRGESFWHTEASLLSLLGKHRAIVIRPIFSKDDPNAPSYRLFVALNERRTL